MSEQVLGATAQDVAAPAESQADIEEINSSAAIPEVSENETAAEEIGAANADNPELAAGNAQSKEDNSRFAALRRRAEAAEIKAKENDGFKNSYTRLTDALASAYGISGSEEDIIDKLTAGAKGISVEQARADRIAEEQRQRQSLENNPEYIRAKNEADKYKSMVVRQMMEADMKRLKAAHPEIKENSMEEFGADMAKLVGIGWDPVDAYEALNNRDSKNIKQAPPSIGSVTSAKPAVEKDYYTPEEARKLTRDQLKDPSIMAKVEKSMRRW